MADRTTYDIRHSQNFLKDRRLVERLLGASSIRTEELVIDIGAGRGLITERLEALGAKVLAIERDPRLAASLRDRFGRSAGVTVCEADFLHLGLPVGPYKVFANIPFNLTAEIVAKLTTAANPPCDSYLAMQREAAERFSGEPRGTLQAMLLAPWFDASTVHNFRRTDFDPMPLVDVVMLRLRKRGPPLVCPSNAQLYRDFLTYCFTCWQPRRLATLRRLFGPHRVDLITSHLGIRSGDTPTTMRFEQWLALFATLKAAGPAPRAHVAHAERRLNTRQQLIEKDHRTRVRSFSGGEGSSARRVHAKVPSN